MWIACTVQCSAQAPQLVRFTLTTQMSLLNTTRPGWVLCFCSTVRGLIFQELALGFINSVSLLHGCGFSAFYRAVIYGFLLACVNAVKTIHATRVVNGLVLGVYTVSLAFALAGQAVVAKIGKKFRLCTLE